MMDATTTATLLSAVSSQGDKSAGAMVRLAGIQKSKIMTDAQADAAAKDFEAMFIAQMLEPMFGESVGSESFGDEDTQEIYRGLLVNEYGKEITRSGGIGIAAHVKQELLRLQEVR